MEIVIPNIPCPLPERVNPHVETVHAQSLLWAKRFGLIHKESAWKRFIGARFAWLASRTYPLAGLDELTLISDWLAWVFLFDDQFDDSQIGKQPEHMLAALNSLRAIVSDEPTMPQSPLGEALVDLWRRACAYTTPDWQKRFVRHFSDYLDGYLWEARHRRSRQVPEVAAYVENRQNVGGVPNMLDLIEISQHIELPPHVYNHPHARILRRTVNHIVTWVNDLYSLRKELARGEVNNLVLVIQQRDRSSLQEAIQRVAAMVESEILLFLETEEHRPHFSPEIGNDLQKFLIDARGWVRGILDWSRESARYSEVEYTTPQQPVSYLEDILMRHTPMPS